MRRGQGRGEQHHGQITGGGARQTLASPFTSPERTSQAENLIVLAGFTLFKADLGFLDNPSRKFRAFVLPDFDHNRAMQIQAGIITISDRAARGQYDLTGGPALKRAAEGYGWKIITEALVPDEKRTFNGGSANR